MPMSRPSQAVWPSVMAMWVMKLPGAPPWQLDCETATHEAAGQKRRSASIDGTPAFYVSPLVDSRPKS